MPEPVRAGTAARNPCEASGGVDFMAAPAPAPEPVGAGNRH
jgi:hypothetical protein